MPIVPPKRMTATIVECRPVNGELKWFRMKLAEPVDFTIGQYASLRFPGELRYHAFSIASSPVERDTIELVVKRERDFTTRMLAAPEGAQFEILLPMGRFMDNLQGDIITIAGGVGVTPFLGMVRWARDLGLKDRQYWLFYSAKTRADIIFEEELREMRKQNPNVHVVITLTRETPEGWDGEIGHFDREKLLRHLGSFEGKSFYSCGPGRMVDAMVQMLQDAGVPREKIFLESWG